MTSHLRLDVGQGAAMWLQNEGIARKVTNKVCGIISKLENTIRDGDSTALYSSIHCLHGLHYLHCLTLYTLLIAFKWLYIAETVICMPIYCLGRLEC